LDGFHLKDESIIIDSEQSKKEDDNTYEELRSIETTLQLEQLRKNESGIASFDQLFTSDITLPIPILEEEKKKKPLSSSSFATDATNSVSNSSYINNNNIKAIQNKFLSPGNIRNDL
jgi:hypothetical protein